ncbi:hypothetical protein ACWGJ9_08875 [Curtobacterium citreum]
MDKHDKRHLRTTAFTRHLTEQLSDEPVQTYPVTPLSEFGPKLDTPAGAYRSAQDNLWAAAARGNAGTGRPIPSINGEPKMKAMRAFIGGGTKANGGAGEAGAAAALRKAGWSGAGTTLAGWGILVGCEVALTVGPPVVAALWKANQEVLAAVRAERDETEAE